MHSNTLAEGLAGLASCDVDAVLLDLGLPDSQGLGTFEKLHAAADHVPIIILTGLQDDVLGLEAVRRGAQDYLMKRKLDGALLIKAVTYSIERKKLDEAMHRQADLIDLSPDAIIIKKPDDTVSFWSLGAEKLYGYDRGEAIGQKAFELLKTKIAQPFESIESKLKEDGKWSGEIIHHTKHGRELSVQSYWLAKFNEKKEIVEIFESNVDITERKNAERLATIGATAGMVGHDIRNPLQTIAGELFLAREGLKAMPSGEGKACMRESLDTIEEQMNYVNKIVSDLQDYARPLKPKLEQVKLKSIVDTVLTSINSPQKIKVKCLIAEEANALQTDKTYLQRILQNLIMNSIQAMPDGGRLTISAQRNSDKVTLIVEDSGEGIPREVRDRLFTPLFTMKSKGQGFGLAVVKKFTEGLGGVITFDSDVGRGTRFIVELPA